MKTFATIQLTPFTLVILIISVLLLPNCTYQYVPPSPLAIKKYQQRPATQKDASPPRGHLAPTNKTPDYVEFQTPDQPREKRGVGAVVSVKY